MYYIYVFRDDCSSTVKPFSKGKLGEDTKLSSINMLLYKKFHENSINQETYMYFLYFYEFKMLCMKSLYKFKLCVFYKNSKNQTPVYGSKKTWIEQ